MGQLRASVRHLDDFVALGQQEDGHTLLLDRPRDTGGTELGFNGGHLLLIGWGACFKSNLVAAAKARDIKIEDLEIRLEGDTAEGPNRFSLLRMTICLAIDGDQAQRDKIIKLAERFCIVSNTLRSSTEVAIISVDSFPN